MLMATLSGMGDIMQTIVKNGKKYKLVAVDEPQGEIVTLERTLKFEVYPEDAPELMTWVKAKEWVDGLDDGWRMPTFEELLLMSDNLDKLTGIKTEAASGSDCPDWSWSSTELRDDRDSVRSLRLSVGTGNFFTLRTSTACLAALCALWRRLRRSSVAAG